MLLNISGQRYREHGNFYERHKNKKNKNFHLLPTPYSGVALMWQKPEISDEFLTQSDICQSVVGGYIICLLCFVKCKSSRKYFKLKV
jgi:hypothetical protein